MQAKDLYRIEMYHREIGTSEFVYDQQLDVFRFPEDGRFAFCEEFADWERLREREYLLFCAGRLAVLPSHSSPHKA